MKGEFELTGIVKDRRLNPPEPAEWTETSCAECGCTVYEPGERYCPRCERKVSGQIQREWNWRKERRVKGI